MKLYKQVRKYGPKAVIGGSALGLSAAANAALPTAVTDAFTTATTDGTTLAYLWVGFVVTIGAIFYLKRRGG